MHAWQIQEAKSRLSELLKQAEREGPQEITLHGRPVAVVLSRAAYDRLASNDRSLAAFIRTSPLADAGDELTIPPRLADPVRPLDL
jgi:prevent-host-death family protein